LRWAQLETLARAAFSSGRIVGCNVTIYNPDMDPDGRHARRIVEFLKTVLGDRIF
jgi:arginase